MCKEKEMKAKALKTFSFSFVLCVALTQQGIAESPLAKSPSQTNSQRDNLDYLLDDYKTKFPVSDYVWQKDKPQQNVYNYFNQQKKGKGNIEFLGYDGYGNPILVDTDGYLTDKEGNLILDSNGNPIKVLKDKLGKVTYVDSNGNAVDSNGKPLLDEYGKPIRVVTDKDGNIMLVNSQGNLANYRGKTILDENGKPIPLTKHQQSLKADMLQEQQRIQQELNRKKQAPQPKRQQSTNNQNAKKPTHNTNKSNSNKTTPQNIDMEVLFLEAFEEKNPLLAEYGDDDFNVNYANAMGLGNASNVDDYGKLFRDSYLGGRGNTQMQEDSTTKYGDSSFSNQENIDEATNEHKLYRTITAGKLIPCILLTPINSEIEGLVSAQVEQDIYAHMGRAVLIPRGSKVIGFYQNDNEIGQDRIQIVWREIITPQGVNIILTNAVASDSEGYAGAKGYLNNRYWQRYGMGITMQTLANAITFGVANATQKPNASAGSSFYTGQILAQSQSDINAVLRQIIAKQNTIRPIIQIKAGSRIYITPTAHIWFPIPKNKETMARYFDDE